MSRAPRHRPAPPDEVALICADGAGLDGLDIDRAPTPTPHRRRAHLPRYPTRLIDPRTSDEGVPPRDCAEWSACLTAYLRAYARDIPDQARCPAVCHHYRPDDDDRTQRDHLALSRPHEGTTC